MEKEILLAPARGLSRDKLFVPVLFWSALVRVATAHGSPEHDNLWPPYDSRLFARALRQGLARLGQNATATNEELLKEENRTLVRAVLAIFDAGDGVTVNKVASRAIRAIPSRYRTSVG